MQLFTAELAERFRLDIDTVTGKIIGSAIKVHRELGPGLLESTYETCLAHELTKSQLRFERQATLPVIYDGVRIDAGYKVDLFVERLVIVELKAVTRLDPIFTAQLMTYLKLSGCHAGLLINFNVRVLPDGLKRIVVDFADPFQRVRR